MIGQHGKRLTRTPSLTLVAALMILFGAAEVVTAFTHHFVGISTSPTALFTTAAVAIGACYILAGGLLLTVQPWAALLAIGLLVADILGRIALVLTGLYLLDSLEQVVGIVGGTVLAGVFALYIGAKWAESR